MDTIWERGTLHSAFLFELLLRLLSAACRPKIRHQSDGGRLGPSDVFYPAYVQPGRVLYAFFRALPFSVPDVLDVVSSYLDFRVADF